MSVVVYERAIAAYGAELDALNAKIAVASGADLVTCVNLLRDVNVNLQHVVERCTALGEKAQNLNLMLELVKSGQLDEATKKRVAGAIDAIVTQINIESEQNKLMKAGLITGSTLGGALVGGGGGVAVCMLIGSGLGPIGALAGGAIGALVTGLGVGLGTKS